MSTAGHASHAMLFRYSRVNGGETASPRRDRRAEEGRGRKREQEAEKRRQQVTSDAMNQRGAASVR